MLEDYEKKKRKQVSTMRSLLDYARGIFFTGIGVLLLFHEKFKISITERMPGGAVKLLGVVFVLYGGWRLYQGYKKNYFK
jgi:hypothetical protein